jgi:hypothetical protein
LHATAPAARATSVIAAIGALGLLRAVLFANMYLAARGGVALIYAVGRARTCLLSLASVVTFVLLAVLLVLAKALFHILLWPLQHVALAIVAAAVAVEALLAGRVFVQLAYDENVEGLGHEVLSLTEPMVEPFRGLEGTAILHDTGVVEFATLTAMEAVLVGAIATVVLLMFWSEFLHMYRRVRDFFIERSKRRTARKEEAAAAVEEEAPAVGPTPLPDMSTVTADLSAAS